MKRKDAEQMKLEKMQKTESRLKGRKENYDEGVEDQKRRQQWKQKFRYMKKNRLKRGGGCKKKNVRLIGQSLKG